MHDRLATFAPLGSANPDDAFREVPLLGIDRHIIAILVSFDSNLLTIESTKWAMGSGEAGEGFSLDPAPVQVNFYRLASTGASAETLQVSSAGAVRARTAIALPLTTAGYLDVLQGGKDRWLFNFDEHTGKVDELAEWDTTCAPHPMFVGHSEFVAFGCRGSDDRLDFAGFNLKGEEMWQQNFLDTHVSPTFSFAPAAGRFALGRTIVSSPFDMDAPLPTSLVSAQEVRVYQSYNGKQLFKIECSPIERAGQNFALSDDGLRLAVVRETTVRHSGTQDTDPYTAREATVEVYTLPPLTKEDRTAVDAAEAAAPADSGVRIDIALQRASKATKEDKAEPAAPATNAASQDGQPGAQTVASPGAAAEKEPGTEAASGASGATSATEGDPVPAAPRKPPTLYGPDEKKPGTKRPE